MKPLIYLASPYTTDDSLLLNKRREEAARAAGWMMLNGLHVFSPITHGWLMSCQYSFPVEFEWWEEICTNYISHCDELMVLCIPGWDTSTGVQAEVRIARALHKPIRYLIPYCNSTYTIRDVI